MVERIRGPRPAAAGVGIPISAAVAPSLAGASVGQALSNAGADLQSVGVGLTKMNKAFEARAQEAENNAVYAKSIREAMLEYQNLFQARVNQVVDEEGNPTFSTMQEDVGNIGRQVLEEHLNTIESPEVRTRFQQNFEAYASNQQMATISMSRNQRLSFISESVSESVAELGSIAGASNAEDSVFFENLVTDILNVAVFEEAMTPEERFTAQDAFRKEVATARVRNQINDDPVQALSTLQTTSAEDLGLRELERLALENEARVATNRLLTGQDALAREQEKYIRDQLNEFESIIDFGGQIPEESIDDIVNLIGGTEFEQRFIDIMMNAEVINQFTMHDTLSRESIVNQLNADDTLNLNGLKLRQKLREINGSLNSKMKNDVVSLAIEQGIIENPEPFNPQGDIGEQLAARQAPRGFVEEHFGIRTGGLTKEELNGFQEAYSDGDYQTRSKMLGAVVEAMGSSAIHLLGDLATNGSSQMAAIGSLVLGGDSATAVTILKGQEIIKNDPKIIPPDFTEKLLTAMGSTLPFYDLPQHQQDILEMAKAAYAAKAFEAYDFSGDTDRRRLEAAIRSVSNGGAISYNSNNIEPPVNGMTSNEFKKWIRNVTVDQINATGGWKGFEDDEITKNIKRAQLLNKGAGQYLVWLQSGNGAMRPVIANNNQPFVLNYNLIEGKEPPPLISRPTSEIQMNVDEVLESFTQRGLRGEAR